MPEEVEIETRELQETIEELHEERREREESERKSVWTRYVALSTAILAVFAAVGAMQSGALVNEAMMRQIQAADKWNEYQAARLKDHAYTIAANTLLDNGAAPPKAEASEHQQKTASETASPASSGAEKAPKSEKKVAALHALTPTERLADYLTQRDKQAEKEKDLSGEAKSLETESHESLEKHEKFAMSVAFIQVAIALGAVAALTRIKPIWYGSILFGVVGIVYFARGFLKF